jgi:hypothetical protein
MKNSNVSPRRFLSLILAFTLGGFVLHGQHDYETNSGGGPDNGPGGARTVLTTIGNRTTNENTDAVLTLGTSVQFELKAYTGEQQDAGTASPVGISFYVNDEWTAEETFFSAADDGEVISKIFTTPSSPSKVKFIAKSTDAWGFWQMTLLPNDGIRFDKSNVDHHAQGPEYGDNDFWIDLDDNRAREVQEINLKRDYGDRGGEDYYWMRYNSAIEEYVHIDSPESVTYTAVVNSGDVVATVSGTTL